MTELTYETPQEKSERLKREAKEKKKAMAKAERGSAKLQAQRVKEEEKELRFSKLKSLLKKGSDLEGTKN